MTVQRDARTFDLEVEGTRRLQAVSTRLIGDEGPQAVYDEILDALVAIAGSDLASLQSVESTSDGETTLRLLGDRGFDERTRARTLRLAADSPTLCALALQRVGRVAVTDLLAPGGPFEGPELELFRDAGIRGVVSTALVARGGDVVGVMSVHWRAPHAASPVELRLLDILARQAADLVERTRAAEALHESETRHAFLL